MSHPELERPICRAMEVGSRHEITRVLCGLLMYKLPMFQGCKQSKVLCSQATCNCSVCQVKQHTLIWNITAGMLVPAASLVVWFGESDGSLFLKKPPSSKMHQSKPPYEQQTPTCALYQVHHPSQISDGVVIPVWCLCYHIKNSLNTRVLQRGKTTVGLPDRRSDGR